MIGPSLQYLPNVLLHTQSSHSKNKSCSGKIHLNNIMVLYNYVVHIKIQTSLLTGARKNKTGVPTSTEYSSSEQQPLFSDVASPQLSYCTVEMAWGENIPLQPVSPGGVSASEVPGRPLPQTSS